MPTTLQTLKREKLKTKKLCATIRKLKRAFASFDVALSFTGDATEACDTDKFEVYGLRGRYMRLRRAFDAI